jgi:hypothetical protein
VATGVVLTRYKLLPGNRTHTFVHLRQSKNLEQSEIECSLVSPPSLYIRSKSFRSLVQLFVRTESLGSSPKEKQNKRLLARKRTIPTQRPLQPATLVPTFAGRSCCVVSATDPYGRSCGVSRPESLLLLSIRTSIILSRLSGPRSRPTTSQKIW